MNSAPPRRFSPGLPVWIILILAAGIRVAYLWLYQSIPDWTQLTVDNYYHLHWAESLASGDLLGGATYFRAPFYVYCLGLLYSIFGASLWTARIFGCLTGLGSVALTYLLGKRIFGRQTGLIAAAAMAVLPANLYFEAELLLDPLFTFLMLLSLHRAAVWFDTARPGDAFLCGLAFSFAAITRPTVLVVVPVVIVLYWLNHRNARSVVKPIFLCVAGTAIAIAPVFARNLAVAGDPVAIASQGGINLYIGNNPAADGVSAILPEPLGFNWQIAQITHIAEQTEGRPLLPGEVSDFWRDRAFDWIRAHPADWLWLWLKRAFFSISDSEISNNRSLGEFWEKIPILEWNPLSFGFVFATGLLGLIVGWRRSPAAVLIALTVLAYTAATALFFFNSRFRLPLAPLYLIMGAYGVVYLWRLTVERRLPALALSLVLTVAAGMASIAVGHALPKGSPAQPLVSKGLYLYNVGDYITALRYERTAFTVDSTFPEANLNAGNCWLKLGRLDSARACYDRELALHPGRHRALTNLASLALVQNQYGQAQTLARQALATAPYDVTAQRALLRGMAADSGTTHSRFLITVDSALLATDSSVYVLNDAGLLLLSRGDTARAVSLLTTATTVSPPPVETDDGAFSYAFPNGPRRLNPERASAHYELGFLAGLQGSFGEAISESRRAIELDSTLVAAYVNLASGLVSTGSVADADSVLAEARRRFPDHPQLGAWLIPPDKR